MQILMMRCPYGCDPIDCTCFGGVRNFKSIWGEFYEKFKKIISVFNENIIKKLHVNNIKSIRLCYKK